MKKLSIFCAIVFCLTLLTSSAFAWDKPIRMKLRRGAVNLISFPLEIPKQISLSRQIAKEKKVYSYPWIITGFFKGVFTGVGRLGSGAWDVVTCNLPIPEGYEPLMEPDYVYERFAPDLNKEW